MLPDEKNYDSSNGIAQSASVEGAFVMYRTVLGYAKVNGGFFYRHTWYPMSRFTRTEPLGGGYYRVQYS